jgi:RNA polymerase sigma factor (sigma-70 family)
MSHRQSAIDPSPTIQGLTALLDGSQITAAGRQQLLQHAHHRLRELAHRQLRKTPALARWEQTDDVLQGALIRLDRALQQVEVRDARHFLSLASTMIRRELIDLKRKLFGPLGLGAHHATHDPERTSPLHHAPGSPLQEPALQAQWEELHEHVETLPVELREVTDLVLYQELTMEDAAKLLGVSSKTISRRWREARLALAEHLSPEP